MGRPPKITLGGLPIYCALLESAVWGQVIKTRYFQQSHLPDLTSLSTIPCSAASP